MSSEDQVVVAAVTFFVFGVITGVVALSLILIWFSKNGRSG